MKFEEFRNWLRNNDFTTDISIDNSYDYYWELIFEKEYFNNEFQYFIDEPVGENKDYICLNAFKLLNISNVDDYKIFDNFDLKMFLYYFKFKDLFKNKKYEFTVEMIPPIDCTIEEWNNIEFTEDFASPLICKTDISLEKKYIDVVEQHNDNYFVTGQLTNKQIDWIVNFIDKKMKDFIDKNPIDKFITLLKSVRFINLDCGNNEDILNIKYKI